MTLSVAWLECVRPLSRRRTPEDNRLVCARTELYDGIVITFQHHNPTTGLFWFWFVCTNVTHLLLNYGLSSPSLFSIYIERWIWLNSFRFALNIILFFIIFIYLCRKLSENFSFLLSEEKGREEEVSILHLIYNYMNIRTISFYCSNDNLHLSSTLFYYYYSPLLRSS